MTLRTIWTIPAMTTKERILRSREELARVVAAKLPLRIRYWVAIQMVGYATMTSKNVPATPLDEVLKNLPAPKNIH